MAYGEKVLDHYENPRNVGSFEKTDTDVGTGMVGAPACGDVMRLQIKVSDEGVIEDAAIVPPTSQNQKTIEDDLRTFVPKYVDLPDKD